MSPDVTPVETLLDQAARRRFTSYLDTLPKPGPLPAATMPDD